MKRLINEQNTLEYYLLLISEIPLLNINKEKELIISFKNGNMSARKILIESNLRLVVSIAKYYINKGLTLEDLIGEGNIGLIKALDYYNIDENVKFSTYATFWIKKMITLALIKFNNIPLSPKLYYKIIHLKEKKKQLYNILYREPTIKELSNYTNIKENKIINLLKYDYILISIDDKINGQSDESLKDFIYNEDISLEDEVINKDYKNFMHYIIFESNILNEQQKKIISMRFGFDTKVYTYAEIGEYFNISGEAVRQKITKALTILVSIYGYDLLEYIENKENAIKIIENAKNGKFRIIAPRTRKNY